MTIYNNSNIRQQYGTVTSEAAGSLSNPGYAAQNVIGSQYVVAALPGTVEAQERPQPEEAMSQTTSYAVQTWIKVSDKARTDLSACKGPKIKEWTGKSLDKVINGAQKHITVREARLINLKANAPVFDITAENVLKFPIDQIIRDRLTRISPNQIKVNRYHLNRLTNIIRSIKAEKAKEYNDSIGFQLFDKERVFDLANNEPIVDKMPIITSIQIEPNHRKNLQALSAEHITKLRKIFGDKFINVLYRNQTISIDEAKLISKVSGQDVFELKKGAPDLPAPSQGTKRPLDVSPTDPSELSSKRPRNDVDVVNALGFTYSIPPAQVFTYENPRAEFPRAQVFTYENPPTELPPAQVFTYENPPTELPPAQVFTYENPPTELPPAQVFNFNPPAETDRNENSSAEQLSLLQEVDSFFDFTPPAETDRNENSSAEQLSLLQEVDSFFDFTPPAETDRNENSSAEQPSLSPTNPSQTFNDSFDFGVGDELYDFLLSDSSSTATSASSIEEISPFPFTYDG